MIMPDQRKIQIAKMLESPARHVLMHCCTRCGTCTHMTHLASSSFAAVTTAVRSFHPVPLAGVPAPPEFPFSSGRCRLRLHAQSADERLLTRASGVDEQVRRHRHLAFSAPFLQTERARHRGASSLGPLAGRPRRSWAVGRRCRKSSGCP